VTEPIVLRNDVPMLERLLAVFFVAVGAPLTYLGFTASDELPDLVVPAVQVGFPLFLVAVVWWAFVHRRRLLVILHPGDPVAVFEERVLLFTKRWSGAVVGVDIEMGEDIDGDPYGSLILRMADTEVVVAAEGNDIATLETQRSAVQEWLESHL
jgi:hypothetical protein